MKKKLIIVFIAAIVLRLLLVFSAYHGDLNNNISWGTLAVERGLSGFYESANEDSPNMVGTQPCPSVASCEGGWPYSAPNQPPLTVLMFTGLRLIWLGVNNISWWLNNSFKIFPSAFIWFWEQKGMVLLIKLPSILADLGIGWMIYRYLGERLRVKGKRKEKALLIASVWLFNPIVWYNSAVWGQTDSVVNLLGLLGILGLLEKKLVKFSFWFTLSFLFKGSLGIFIPILGMIAIWQNHKLLPKTVAIALSFCTIIFVSVWFHPSLDFFPWLIDLYRNRILPGEIGYLTANAFNLWWLVDSGKTLDSTIYFGLSARVWGIVITLLGILGILKWLWRCYSERPKGVEESQNTDLSTSLKMTRSRIPDQESNQSLQDCRDDRKIFLSLILVSFISFLFMTRIHERYLYPLFPYATISLAFFPQLLAPYIILSITHLLNLYHLFWAPSFSLVERLYDYVWFPLTFSIVNILVFLHLLRYFRKAKV